MTRFLFAFLLALPVMGAVGPASFTNGNSIFVDGLAGVDGTAVKYSRDKPFKTLTAAKNAASAGDTIFVFPGSFVANDLLKLGVNYEFLGVGKVSWVTADFEDPSWAIVDDRQIATGTTNTINAPGWTFIVTNIAEAAVANGVLVETNPLSRITFTFAECQLIRGDATDETIRNAVIIQTHGWLSINGKISSADFPSANPVYGIYWERGELHARGPYIKTENSCIWGLESPGNTLPFSAWLDYDYYDQIGGADAAIYMTGINPTYKMWVEGNEIRSTNNGFGAIAQRNGGKLYVEHFGKIIADADPGVAPEVGAAISVSGGTAELWVDSQKLSARKTWLSTTNDCVTHLTIGHYEQIGAGSGGAVHPAFYFGGGTNFVEGGHGGLTNGIGILSVGANETLMKDFTLRVANVGGSGNSNEVASIRTNGFTFQNSALFAMSGQDSIKATNTINPVSVQGTLQMSTAPNASTRFSSGVQIVGTNFYVIGDAFLQAVNLRATTITNNTQFISTNMVTVGDVTNFVGTYNNRAVTYLMTAAWRLTNMTDVPAANVDATWTAKLRNYSGGALRVSFGPGFRRNFTNDISLGNNQNIEVEVKPDGTGGTNPTNQLVKVTFYNSP